MSLPKETLWTLVTDKHTGRLQCEDEGRNHEKRSVSGHKLEAQTVKNLPAMQETQVRSLGWEAPLEKGMATHFSVLI